MDLLGTGIYPIHQAARLIGEQPRALHRWLRGYSRKNKGEQVRSAALWETQLKDQGLAGDVIGFRDLLEVRLVSAFVRHGVDLRVIRATLEAAARDFGQEYPLSSKQFLTDGKRIFLQAIEETTGEAQLVDVLRRQFVFSDIIKPSLYEGIEYGEEGAVRWYPLANRKTIVLDPAVQFGAPIVTEAGIPTDTIYASFLAEERNETMVARIFSIAPQSVIEAVEYESRLAA
jgi:uncharacterized protein (DUF433 family)